MNFSRISALRESAPFAAGNSSAGSHRASLYLTFDDGPDPEWTPRVFDALALAQARATFFVVGKLARAHPQLVRRAVREGHTIGNHTWSHRHPWTLTSDAGRHEVLDGAAAIADITGTQPAYFRPPHGRLKRCMVETAMATGQSVLLWSLSVRDWGTFGRASSIAERLGRARSEDIVLMHDGPMRINRPDQLLRALPDFLYRNRDNWRYRELGTPTSVRQTATPSPSRDTAKEL